MIFHMIRFAVVVVDDTHIQHAHAVRGAIEGANNRGKVKGKRERENKGEKIRIDEKKEEVERKGLYSPCLKKSGINIDSNMSFV